MRLRFTICTIIFAASTKLCALHQRWKQELQTMFGVLRKL